MDSSASQSSTRQVTSLSDIHYDRVRDARVCALSAALQYVDNPSVDGATVSLGDNVADVGLAAALHRIEADHQAGRPGDSVGAADVVEALVSFGNATSDYLSQACPGWGWRADESLQDYTADLVTLFEKSAGVSAADVGMTLRDNLLNVEEGRWPVTDDVLDGMYDTLSPQRRSAPGSPSLYLNEEHQLLPHTQALALTLQRMQESKYGEPELTRDMTVAKWHLLAETAKEYVALTMGPAATTAISSLAPSKPCKLPDRASTSTTGSTALQPLTRIPSYTRHLDRLRM